MSIRDRIMKVGAVKSSEIILFTIIRFCSVPLFLHFWSTNLYGEWLILYSLISYFSLGNMGVSQAAANEMTMALVKDDKRQVAVTYQSAFLSLCILSVIVIAVGTLMIFAFPLQQWLRLELISYSDLKHIIVLFISYIVSDFMMGLLMAGYRCVGKYHRGLLFLNAAVLIEFILLAFVLFLGFGPISVAASMAVARWLCFIFMSIDLSIIQPWLRLGVSKASFSEFKRLLGPSLSFAAYPLGSMTINQGVIIGIGILISPAAVVLFSTLRTLTNLLTRLFDIINQPLYPEISMAWGSHNTSLLIKLHRVSNQLSFWLSIIGALALIISGPILYKIWTHGKLFFDMPIFLALLSTVVIRSLWYTSFVIPSAINRHQKLTISYLILSFLGLIISISFLYVSLLLSIWGLAIIEIGMTYLVLSESLHLLNDNKYTYFQSILFPPNPYRMLTQLFNRHSI